MRRGVKPAAAVGLGKDGYWQGAWVAATILCAILSIRLAEVMPLVAAVRPAILVLVTAVPLLLFRTGRAPLVQALTNPATKLLFVYMAIAAIGVPFAVWRGAAASQVSLLGYGILVVVSVLLVRPTVQNMDRLAFAFMLVVTATGGFALAKGSTIDYRLATGGAYDPNDLASLLASGIPFAVAVLIRGTAWRKLLALACCGILTYALLETGSRGGVVGVAAGILVLVAGMKASRLVMSSVLAVIFAVVAWQFAPPVFKDRLASMASLESDYNMTEDSGRIGTWTRGIGYAVRNPVLGVGIGNFAFVEGQRYARLNQPGVWQTAHNAYIQAFAELGLGGGVVFLLILLRATRNVLPFWRPRSGRDHGLPERPEYLATIVVFASAGFFLSHAYAYHLFTLLALAAHAGQVAAAEQQAIGRPAVLVRGGRPRARAKVTHSGILMPRALGRSE